MPTGVPSPCRTPGRIASQKRALDGFEGAAAVPYQPNRPGHQAVRFHGPSFAFGGGLHPGLTPGQDRAGCEASRHPAAMVARLPPPPVGSTCPPPHAAALPICSVLRLASARQEIEACGMSANKSQRQLASSALASMVAAYPEWHLVATCRQCCACRTRLFDCGRCPARTLPMVAMPGGITVSALLRRLHCRTCGAKPDRVWLHLPDPVEWRRRTLPIRGRGAA